MHSVILSSDGVQRLCPAIVSSAERKVLVVRDAIGIYDTACIGPRSINADWEIRWLDNSETA